MLTIALSKGRILDDTLPLLAEAGIVPTENPDKSRKLIIPTTQDDVRLLIVRATDVRPMSSMVLRPGCGRQGRADGVRRPGPV